MKDNFFFPFRPNGFLKFKKLIRWTWATSNKSYGSEGSRKKIKLIRIKIIDSILPKRQSPVLYIRVKIATFQYSRKIHPTHQDRLTSSAHSPCLNKPSSNKKWKLKERKSSVYIPIQLTQKSLSCHTIFKCLMLTKSPHKSNKRKKKV